MLDFWAHLGASQSPPDRKPFARCLDHLALVVPKRGMHGPEHGVPCRDWWIFDPPQDLEVVMDLPKAIGSKVMIQRSDMTSFAAITARGFHADSMDATKIVLRRDLHDPFEPRSR